MVHNSRTVLTRTAPAPDFAVAYGPHPDQVADVRLPTDGAKSGHTPLVLFVHGGFWRHEWDRTHAGPLAAALAELGYTVANLEYRRTGAPDGLAGWPATVEDVAGAVRKVPGLVAAEMGTEPTVVVVAGHSAGGHLALCVAAGLALEGRAPAGVVALAPVADLRLAYDMDLDGGAVRALVEDGPEAVPDRYMTADPMSLLPIGARMFIVHGGHDVLVPPELSRRFVAAALAAGDDVRLDELPNAEHFDVIDPESPAWPAVVQAFHTMERA